MLKRTLCYTALTRAKKLAVIVGSVKAMRLAVKQTDTNLRITMLTEKIILISNLFFIGFLLKRQMFSL